MFSKTISVRWLGKWGRAAQGNPARASVDDLSFRTHAVGERIPGYEVRKVTQRKIPLKLFERIPYVVKGGNF